MSIKLISENKKARFDYEIVETFEAGIQLTGSEVKSLRAGQCNLKDSYISFVGNEAFLQNAHISVYTASSYNNHDPERLRKILMHRKELDTIYGALRERGLTCVPLKIYFSKGIAKLQLALVRGKKKGDKREAIQKREVSREMSRSLKHNRNPKS